MIAMEKDEAINDFLKGFRIVLNNAYAYPKDHPYFKKSVEVFKQKLDTLFAFLSPIKIDFTAESLFLDARFWEKLSLYVEIASMFHLRKIKSIEFRQGVAVQELVDFLSSIALPLKDILRQGGMRNILKTGNNAGILVEELDYSQLLKGEGEEVKDVWVYLFKEAVEKKDYQKINEYADNFEKIIGKFNANDLSVDDELRQNVSNFLSYLKDKEKEKFHNCNKGLLKTILKDRNISQEDKLDKIKVFFKDSKKEDLAEILWEGISKDDDFNYLSLAVFSRLFDEDTHKAIVPALEEKIKERDKEILKANPKIRKKIKELFSTTQNASIPTLYQHALSWLSEGASSQEDFSLDHNLLNENYRFILLNLIADEQDKQTLNLAVGFLSKECSGAVAEKNTDYLKSVLELIDKKIKQDAALSEIFEGSEKCIANFVEDMAFQESPPQDLDYFIDTLRINCYGSDFYLEKIFKESKVNIYALKLFLKFFPEKAPLFLENLKQRHFDLDFLVNIVKCLELIGSSLTLEMLKEIFSFSNNIVKIEILKSMQALSRYDYEFLLSVLKKGETLLKREALVILRGNEKMRRIALEELFSIPSPWGRNNQLLIENITVAEELKLREAQEYLEAIGKRRFFWNRELRSKAKDVLKKWNARKY
jgi:hypothetical protein